MENTSNFIIFMNTYANNLEKARNEYPELYSWPVEMMHVVFDRMVRAIQKGTFNKDSHAMRWTCKELKIKHTYKAISEFIGWTHAI